MRVSSATVCAPSAAAGRRISTLDASRGCAVALPSARLIESAMRWLVV